MALIVLLTCSALPTLVSAQGIDVPDNVDQGSIAKRANEITQRIRTSLARLDRHLQEIHNANYEDSLVLRLQINDLRVQVLQDVHALADELIAAERTEPQPELRASLVSMYEQVTPRLWFHIRRLEDEIDAQRALRASSADEDLASLEDVIAILTGWLDNLYDLGMTHLNKMDALGMDTTEARSMLSDLLEKRADRLSGRIKLALLRIDKLEARRKESPDPASLMPILVAAHAALETNTTTMRRTLDHMDALGLGTTEYREQLVTASRDLTTSILNRAVALSIIRRWVRSMGGWVREHGGNIIFKALIFVVILFLARMVSRVARAAVERSLDSAKVNVSRLGRRMLVNSTANLVMALGLMLALNQVGVSLGPLLAGVGVAGFIVGFALQDSLANFASGMMILFYRPYDVGDVVEAGGVFGKVDKMSLVSTTVLTFDNQEMVVPNNKIWGDVIKNVTAQSKRRVDMVFGISYKDDIPKAEKILQDILAHHDKVLDDPEPMVRLHKLNESSVDFVVRPWVAVSDYWDVYWDVTRAVKMRFDEEDVSIPFPQRDVHFYREVGAGDPVIDHGEAMKQQKGVGLVQKPETDDEEGDETS